ncbi:MAG: MaoC family dehydratase [Dehalococcoidales bacterium]|nr:MAG: MaoC family dehydratase [Dehalococcoidales bacterium]
MAIDLNGLSIDTSFPELRRQVTQEHVNLYAEASKDFNPIHIDPEFARQAGLDGTIAHGMLILAYVSEFMTSSFGQSWLTGGNLIARFKTPARPGDTITVSGKVTGLQRGNGTLLVDCDILCQNQRDEPVIICETKVRVKTDEDSS